MNVNAPQPAEEALRPSEQDCRLIVDSIPGHVVTLTADGDIEFVNQQWLDYLGKTLDELKSWTNSGVVHPDDFSRVLSTWNRSVETGQPYDSECRFCRADGVFRWFHEKEMIEAALRKSEVRVYGPSGAAAKLGISRSTLESKIRSLRSTNTTLRLQGARKHS